MGRIQSHLIKEGLIKVQFRSEQYTYTYIFFPHFIILTNKNHSRFLFQYLTLSELL